MSNRDTEAAWRYHEATKHSYLSVRRGGHVLDWDNQPRPFKVYRGLPPIPLPRDLRATGATALAAVAPPGIEPEGEVVPDLRDLAAVLYLAAGVTKRKVYPSGEVVFRAASCTGALYEVDLYVVCRDLSGLTAGVYHFDPVDFVLRRLRAGDHRGRLAWATAGEPSVVHAPAVLVSTATYWRNAWKYRDRTYRHFGWDGGTILANALAAAAAVGLPARVVLGFVDDTVNDLLGLGVQREVAFSLLALGTVDQPPLDAPEPAAINVEIEPYSREEVDYPLMREIHAESSLETADEVAAWRGRTPRIVMPGPADGTTALQPLLGEALPTDALEDVVVRRGSTRRFDRRASIGFDQLSTLLDRSTQSIPADFLEPAGALLNQLYLIVNAVDGLAPGAYAFHRESRKLERLREGDFRGAAGYLGLEQALPADASAVVFYLTDLDAVLGRFGNRGYRAAQLEAGILGGRLYLAAYALGLGASGLTFYDDDVPRFFSPHADGKSAVFVMTVGRSARVLPVGRAERWTGVRFGAGG
jgi:SagB-type dehydrogenase family enzyme